MCAVRRREERRASRLAFSPWRPRWLPPHARALFQIPAPARRRHFSELRAPPQIRLFHARVSTVSPVLQRGDRAEQRDMHKTCIILMHTYAYLCMSYAHRTKRCDTRTRTSCCMHLQVRQTDASRSHSHVAADSQWPRAEDRQSRRAERGNLSIRRSKAYRTTSSILPTFPVCAPLQPYSMRLQQCIRSLYR